MIFLGLDVATKTGWAILDDRGVRIDSGVWDCSIRDGEGAGMRLLRLSRFIEAFTHPPERSKDVIVAYEDNVFTRGRKTSNVLAALRGVVQSTCESLGIETYTGIDVADVKRTATGGARASKEQIVAAAERRWSVTCESDDEADALWIAETARLRYAEGEA